MVVLCAALTASPASAQRRGGGGDDAPHPALAWTAEGGDSRLTNQARYGPASLAHVATLGLAWQTRLDGAVVSSPLGLGSRLFIATEGGVVAALDAADGSELWK